MAGELTYQLTFAGTPFCLDQAKVVRINFQQHVKVAEDLLAPRKHQPLADLVDELDRLHPFLYLRDFQSAPGYPGRNLGAIAKNWAEGYPGPEVKIGDYYYPTGASRWSVFRGLATSSMAKDMLDATKGSQAKSFVVKSVPCMLTGDTIRPIDYTITTDMHMLPPIPLGEHGGEFDGLYLITLVDDRYYFQGDSSSLRVGKDTTWASLISSLATILGVTITYSAIDAAYGQPEPDSQLWTNSEDASVLLDAVAANIGRVVVRLFNGSYVLRTPLESYNIAHNNRGAAQSVVRTAGGDLFTSGMNLTVGNLNNSRNAIVPDTLTITFPKYVRGNDPVPHFLNARYRNQRASVWYEESYGDTYGINVPIKSGTCYVGSPISGIVSGTGNDFLHTTAKALLSGEAQTTPLNNSGLTSLAMQMARDYYTQQCSVAFDESYPGTYNWTPEGIHDVIWTYSARTKQAITRVLRTFWNSAITEFQHSAVALSGSTNVTKGVGGPSIAQTWRDSFSGSVSVLLGATLLSGETQATFQTIDNLPTQNRWKGRIDVEDILFEGTSGGIDVDIVARGIDETIEVEHDNASTVTWLTPNTTYGVNLQTTEKMQWVFPSNYTSGGIQGINFVPQTQTVRSFDSSGTMIKGILHFSGVLQVYDSTQVSGSQYQNREYVWLTERNSALLLSGQRYDGQFVGFSASGPVSPVYAVDQASELVLVSGGTFTLTSGIITSGYIGDGAVVSGSIASGQIGKHHIGSGAVCSGKTGSGSIWTYNIASGALEWWHFARCLSGVLCSGSIFTHHLASGSIQTVNVASGQITTYHLASGVCDCASATGTVTYVDTMGMFPIVTTSGPITASGTIKIGYSGLEPYGVLYSPTASSLSQIPQVGASYPTFLQQTTSGPVYDTVGQVHPKEADMGLSGTYNDLAFDVTASCLKINASGNVTITGIAPPTIIEPLELTVECRLTSPGLITFRHQNAGSAADHRMVFRDGTDPVISGGQTVRLIYDTLDQRWIELGRTGATGAGAGSVTNVEGLGVFPLQVSSGPITASGRLFFTWSGLTQNSVLFAATASGLSGTVVNTGNRPKYLWQLSGLAPEFVTTRTLWPTEEIKSGSLTSGGTVSNVSTNDTTGVVEYTVPEDTFLTGFTAPSPTESRFLIVINRTGSGGRLILVHDASSSATNRILTPTEANHPLTPGQCAILKYSTLDSRWYVLAQPPITLYNSDPSGILDAENGTPLWDETNRDLYINVGGTTWQLIGGQGALTEYWEYYRETGSSKDRWYSSDFLTKEPGQNAAISSGWLYAMPFIAPKGGTIDRMAIRTGTGGGGGAAQGFRIGIYSRTGTGDNYPSALLKDAGTVSIGAGAAGDTWNSVTISPAITVNRRTLYWLVVGTDNVAGIAMMGTPNTNIYAVNGWDDTLTTGGDANCRPSFGFRASYALGALPGTFPTTSGEYLICNGDVIPLVFVRFAT